MKEFLFGAAAIVAAGAAFAQAPAAPGTPAAPPMAGKEQSRAEMLAKVREHFTRLDVNRDGALTRDEAEAGRKVLRERIRERLAERGEDRLVKRDPNAAFDRLDANRDGSISREEFAKGHEMRVERRIVMTDKVESGKEGRHAAPGMRLHRFGGLMGGHMFDMADTNKDGRVTLQEATDAAARHFDMADANKDGRVTPDERRQMHRQMIEKHRASKAG